MIELYEIFIYHMRNAAVYIKFRKNYLIISTQSYIHLRWHAKKCKIYSNFINSDNLLYFIVSTSSAPEI